MLRESLWPKSWDYFISPFAPIIVVVFFSFFLRLITLNLGKSPFAAAAWEASWFYLLACTGLSFKSLALGWCTETNVIWFSLWSPKVASCPIVLIDMSRVNSWEIVFLSLKFRSIGFYDLKADYGSWTQTLSPRFILMASIRYEMSLNLKWAPVLGHMYFSSTF
jgi:hypothetical protein